MNSDAFLIIVFNIISVDFLSSQEQCTAAFDLNNELNQICLESNGRIYGFAVLPFADVSACINGNRYFRYICG